MARHESDREDLMREAVAFRRRANLYVPGECEPVVVGVRESGAWSVYFGGDPVFHFDPESQLRRAFVSGHLFRSQATTMARLVRIRTPSTTSLHRHDLTVMELAEFRTLVAARLGRLANSLRDKIAQVIQVIPNDWPVRDELGEKLACVLTTGLPLSPRVRR
jgi:hypothetical protein